MFPSTRGDRLGRRLRRRRFRRRRLDHLGRLARFRQCPAAARADDGGEPRALELTGEDLHKAVHAYGTNGIITEVEMPLTARYDWVDVIVGFDGFDAATAYALALGEQDGLLKKLVTVVAAPRAARIIFCAIARLSPRTRASSSS